MTVNKIFRSRAAAMALGAALTLGLVSQAHSFAFFDRPVASLAAEPRVSEGDGAIDVRVELDQPARRGVSFWLLLRLSPPNGRHAEHKLATDDLADRSFPRRVVHGRIEAGETGVTLPIGLRDDDKVESTERLRIQLLAVRGARADDRHASVDVLDNDVDTSVNIVHINDHHSHLEPGDVELDFDGVVSEVDSGGFPRVAAKIKQLEGELDNVLKLHAGDAVTGTIYYSLFKGEADAQLMNEVCFDAFALGNHEFDDSDAGLATFLGFLNGNPGICQTPVLAANVVPAVGTPLRPTADESLIQPYVIKEIDGQRVGIIGIDIARKTQISSSPLDSTEFLDEKETAQFYIDELRGMGVNKIVVLSHFQYANEVRLAQELRGVDVIVGGDSHTLLGERFADLGLNPGGPYPTVVNNADGDTACVVQAWQYSDVVGELNVEFSKDGQVLNCAGTPHLLLGDNFDVAGADLDHVLGVIDATPELSIVAPDPVAQSLVDVYAADVEVLKQTIVGTATEDLCLERIPDQGRSNIAGCREKTQANGGDIQQLVTEAFLQRSFRADVALQNSGGVRIDIPAGDISIDDVFTLLPFANTLVELELTGAEIKQVLEEAASSALGDFGSASTGAYPYAANLRWDADLSQPTGSRFSNHEIRRKSTGVWEPLMDDDEVVVVTNSFLAGGGDGYFTFETAADEGRIVDTFIDYAQGFIDYLQQNVGGAAPGDDVLPTPPSVDALSCDDYSTRSFIGADGVERLPIVGRTCE